MQTTMRTRRVDLAAFKAAVLALTFLAGVVIGALAVTFLQRDAAPVPSPRPVSAAPKTDENARLMELNQLPEAARGVPSEEFLKAKFMQGLTGVPSPIVPNYRFLDMNVLPDAAPQATVDTRLLEINRLPGDARRSGGGNTNQLR